MKDSPPVDWLGSRFEPGDEVADCANLRGIVRGRTGNLVKVAFYGDEYVTAVPARYLRKLGPAASC